MDFVEKIHDFLNEILSGRMSPLNAHQSYVYSSLTMILKALSLSRRHK